MANVTEPFPTSTAQRVFYGLMTHATVGPRFIPQTAPPGGGSGGAPTTGQLWPRGTTVVEEIVFGGSDGGSP